MSFPAQSWWSPDGRFLISTDPARLDLGVVHDYLTHRSYWAKGSTREKNERAAAHSLCFGVYEVASGQQVGYARVVTDYTVFAYLCDVFVLEEFRGHGLGKWLVKTVLSHPEISNPRRWVLGTADAHGLYAQHGFGPLPTPERWMVKLGESTVSPI
ncbi:MAG: GNAT family N-acetyltransferase [Hymenobacteraceae bacterium]|nr:GNAT family N-acetyltransferase [Hymenobacteraceae bacterium]